MKATKLWFCVSIFVLFSFSCAQTLEPVPAGTGNADTGTGGGRDCVDNDGDGYGTGSDCRGTDCDDTNAGIWTNCENCTDNDGDGYGDGCSRGADCDDTDRNVNPSRTEIPSNGKDDDCQNGDLQCVDADGDGYGEGAQCRGADCLDTDREVHPGAREVCGNGKDDDCEDGDLACPENCTDEDSDTYGEGADCAGPDCNDRDPAVNPAAEEVCNGKDDDCNDEIDECEDADDECDSSRQICASGFLQPCVRTIDCAGYICYESQCRGGAGVDCDTADHCAGGFMCDPGTHKCVVDPNYNICDDLSCSEDCEGGACCVRELARCVECIEWIDCPSDDDICAGYSCQAAVDRMFDDPGEEGARAPEAQMAHWFADCYHGADSDEITLCGIIDAYYLTSNLNKSDVINWICDTSTDDDFDGGAYNRNAASKIAGCGAFDNEDVDWSTAIVAGDWWELCMWTLPPQGLFDFDPDVVIKDCAEFPAE